MAQALNDDDKRLVLERIRNDSSRLLVLGDDESITIAFKDSFAYKGTSSTQKVARFDINLPPVVLVKSIQSFLDTCFVYGNQTVDEVVDEIYKKAFKPDRSSLTPDQLEDAKARKAYSKHYYGMLQLVMTEQRIASKENRDKYMIVMKLITYLYVRRLLHIFIVSNILVHLLEVGSTSSASSASSSSATASPQFSAVNPREVDLTAKVQDMSRQLTVLESDKNAKIADKQNEIAALRASVEALTAALKEKDERVKVLETNLSQYKDLILESTNLIFNIEEANMRSMAGP